MMHLHNFPVLNLPLSYTLFFCNPHYIKIKQIFRMSNSAIDYAYRRTVLNTPGLWNIYLSIHSYIVHSSALRLVQIPDWPKYLFQSNSIKHNITMSSHRSLLLHQSWYKIKVNLSFLSLVVNKFNQKQNRAVCFCISIYLFP